MDRGWTDAEMALHVGFGWRLVEHVGIDVDEGQILTLFLGEARRAGGARVPDFNSSIPAALNPDRCPFSDGDGRDTWLVSDEPIRGVAAGLDDVLVAPPDAPAELVAAEIFPHVLDRIEFGE